MMAWIGTALQLFGAAVVAANVVSPFWGYAIMTPGAIIWLVISIGRRDWAQSVLQLAFVLLNVLGLVSWAA